MKEALFTIFIHSVVQILYFVLMWPIEEYIGMFQNIREHPKKRLKYVYGDLMYNKGSSL